MIKLTDLLQEGKLEKAAEDYLSMMVKKSPFKGKVYVAGGAVRDMIMGLDPKDIDLVVELPQGGIKFAEWICKKTGVYKKGSNPVIYPTYGTAKFQLYGVKHNGMDIGSIEIEAVMTRTEKYVKGNRKPEVKAGTLMQDVERRDFTVNSLLKDLTTGEIKDLTGMGKADIKRGIVQTPMNPDIIFTEDPLRMLRAIRFTVKYSWDLPLFMIKAIKRNARQINTISKERIHEELNKMLVTKNAKQAIKLMKVTGLMKEVFPELELLIGLKQGKYHKWDGFGHTLEVLDKTPPKLITRLAGLFHDIGKPATQTIVDNEVHFYNHENISGEIAGDILRRLKYPKPIISAVAAAVSNHMKLKQSGSEGDIISDKALRRLKANLGSHLQDTLSVMHADNIAHADEFNMPKQIPKIRARMKDLDDGQGGQPILPIDGDDIMKLFGIPGGELVGKIKDAVRDGWFENPTMTKNQAIDVAKKAYKKYK